MSNKRRFRTSIYLPLSLIMGSALFVALLGWYWIPDPLHTQQEDPEIQIPAMRTAAMGEPSISAKLAHGGKGVTKIPVPTSLVDKWLASAPEGARADSIVGAVADSAHLAIYQDAGLENRFPSANTCATCHPKHYEEWSVSQHAYAQLSPVFNAFQGKISQLTNGTNGDFCIRCHTPVGMNLGEDTFMSNMDRHPTSREGVTCIVCHRLKNPYGKVSGRLAIVEGDIFDPVFGPEGGENLQEVIGSDSFRVNTERGRAGRSIHADAVEFAQIETSELCGTCHDVNLLNGFRLEEAFSEAKASPAANRGVTCQDCHMGKEPGVPSGYERGPAAVVGGKPTQTRKVTNHLFAGPDYSIVHPGIFPFNARASEMASIREWLKFDVEAGWGTDAFEKDVPEDYEFPERWKYADDRYDARDIIEENTSRLESADDRSKAVLRAGYKLGEVHVSEVGPEGIQFKVEVKNGTDGHNVPTGFDAERLVFLEVQITDANGKEVFVSGDRDPNGDVRDLHSLYVHNGEMPLDEQLFSLQSKFITRMIRGGEREQILAVNYSPDPLPFIRPSTRATSLLARPTGVRKHRRTISPGESRWADYTVDDEALSGSRPPYTAQVRLIAQMVPVNLLSEIKDVGFDYYMSPREVADRVVEGAMVLYDWEVKLDGNDQAEIVSRTP